MLCLWLIFEYLRKKEIKKRTVYFCLIAFLAVLAINLFTDSLLLYKNYQAGDFTKYYLPPYSNFYYLKIERIITSSLVNILTGLVVGIIFWLIMKITRGLLLDKQEVGLLVFGALIVGWPNAFIFLFFVFALVVVCNLLLIIIRRKSVNDRFIITPFIPVAIILTILLGNYLSHLTNLFKISI